MPVTLATSQRLPAFDAFDAWCAVGRDPEALPAGRRVAGIEEKVEAAFDDAAEIWWQLAKAMGEDASAALAHTPSCAANVSDFGLMLAWERLVDGWAGEVASVLVVCDDPWLYRHLAARPGIAAGSPPVLLPHCLAFLIRGFAARARVAMAALGAVLALRHRRAVPADRPWILAYGHPRSRSDGEDAYFGGLMAEIPGLRRALHVDAGLAAVRRLESHRTFGLHAWGSPLAALGLAFARWRPRADLRNGRHGWLIRRAAAREGGTGQAAMIAWQIHCQERWLDAARPVVVAWPWENHSWERALVRVARRRRVATVGYQHATVGWREWNYSAQANSDGVASLPDSILCTGEVPRRRLAEWGHDGAGLKIGGALRFQTPAAPRRAPDAPVFVALPFDGAIAAEMIQAIRPLAKAGRRFLVKDHPLSPFAFRESTNLARCGTGLAEQPALSAVLYAVTTVGLEAVLADLPTLRFRPAKKVAVDVVPVEAGVPAAAAADLATALTRLGPPRPIPRESMFAAADKAAWRAALMIVPKEDAKPPPSALVRRLSQLAGDPVLRRWLVGRALGREKAVPAVAGDPPYLSGFAPSAGPTAAQDFTDLAAAPPTEPCSFALHGHRFDLVPGQAIDLFRAPRRDLETYLGLHRFAWLGFADDLDDAWVAALWDAWRRDFAEPGDDWPWHPYTAAERAINIIDFAARRGLPGPRAATLDLIAEHARVIRRRLEYFGDSYTGNHLANDGRGLYRIGLALGLGEHADVGEHILIEEAKRIFAPSGVLREGSSHYHILVLGWYLDCLAAARRHGRPEAGTLADIAARGLAAVPRLTLPGGMPLIGDISPDCPPAAILARLPARPETAVAGADLSRDGWLKADFGDWAGLWHAAPGGFAPMPGHGHQDVGAAEIHFAEKSLFVDLGRGAYGDSGAAAFYRTAAAHNALTVDDADPYPTNRPYYDEGFRRRAGGPPPALERIDAGVRVRHHGFARLDGVGAATRTWRFDARSMTIADEVAGSGRHRIVRRLHTTLPVLPEGSGFVVEGDGVRFRVSADVPAELEPAVRWHAYGEGRPATAIEFAVGATLPWRGEIRIEAV